MPRSSGCSSSPRRWRCAKPIPGSVGLFATEAPQVDEVCHIWAYPDLNARTAVRGAVANDPAWQEFLKTTTGLIEEMHSTVMLPAPHSPLQ